MKIKKNYYLMIVFYFAINMYGEQQKEYRKIYKYFYVKEKKDTLFSDIEYGHYDKYLKKNDTVSSTKEVYQIKYIQNNIFICVATAYIFIVKNNNNKYTLLDKLEPISVKGYDIDFIPMFYNNLNNKDILVQYGDESIILRIYRIQDNKFILKYESEDFINREDEYSSEKLFNYQIKDTYIQLTYIENLENKKKKKAIIKMENGEYLFKNL